jgi:hypothetical protein
MIKSVEELENFFSQFNPRQDDITDSWSEVFDAEDENIPTMEIGRFFPFLGRDDALGRLKTLLLRLWR